MRIGWLYASLMFADAGLFDHNACVKIPQNDERGRAGALPDRPHDVLPSV